MQYDTTEESQVLAQYHKEKINEVIAAAIKDGFSVSVEHRHLYPPRTGGYFHMVEVSPQRNGSYDPSQEGEEIRALLTK